MSLDPGSTTFGVLDDLSLILVVWDHLSADLDPLNDFSSILDAPTDSSPGTT